VGCSAGAERVAGRTWRNTRCLRGLQAFPRSPSLIDGIDMLLVRGGRCSKGEFARVVGVKMVQGVRADSVACRHCLSVWSPLAVVRACKDGAVWSGMGRGVAINADKKRAALLGRRVSACVPPRSGLQVRCRLQDRCHGGRRRVGSRRLGADIGRGAADAVLRRCEPCDAGLGGKVGERRMLVWSDCQCGGGACGG
jgi:hypothetical protein